MLGKLAYRNTKRNIKDYLIYLITVTASFSLIFAFNLVASSDEIVKLCSSMDAFKNSLFAVNILIVFVICKLRSNGMPVPLLRNCYSIFNGTKYR